MTVVEASANQLQSPLFSLHLDLIRGLAALAVFAGHLRLIVTGHTGAGDKNAVLGHPAGATGLGHAGVVVFFVLSGYLVGGSVVRDFGNQRFVVATYAIRRLTRLYTVLLPALLLGWGLDFLNGLYWPSSPIAHAWLTATAKHDVWPAVLFLQNVDWLRAPPFGSNVALWSLSNEFWYYVLFPLLLVGVVSKSRWRLIQLLAGCLLWVLTGWSIAEYFFIWLLGVVAYVVPLKLARIGRLETAIVLAQFGCTLYFVRSRVLPALGADALTALSFTLLLWVLLHQTNPARSSLYRRVTHTLAAPSYTLYAFHLPIIAILAAWIESSFPYLARNSMVTMMVITGGTFSYIAATYYAFERNTERIRKAIESRLFSVTAIERPKGIESSTRHPAGHELS